MDELSGKTAVVTGASSGIGKAIALRFGALGMKVILIARRKNELKKVQHGIQAQGGTAFIYPLDLTRPEAIAKVFRQIHRERGPVQVLVNNAGIGSFGKPVVHCSLQEYEQTFDVNLRAVFLVTKAVLPSMLKVKEGTIINIGSTYGKNGIPRSAFYCASKFALEGFSEALLHEVREYNIGVCLISPERVRIEALGKDRPIKGNLDHYISVEDVARAAVFCARHSTTATVREVILYTRRPI